MDVVQNQYYELACVVEFEDVDTYGIAHHSKLINFLERARVHFFNDASLSVSEGEFNLVLMSMEISFKKPVKMMEKVFVKMRVQKLTHASVVWDYEIFNEDDELIVKAGVKQGSVDQNTLKPARIPEKFKNLLETIKG